MDDIFRGSRDAMHRLYERYVGHAMAVALRYAPLREDAEDVVQDSFIKVFAAIPRIFRFFLLLSQLRRARNCCWHSALACQQLSAW